MRGQDLICIFCPNILGPDTKPEHVLHNGLGGRMTTRRSICSECNSRFGSGIDKVLVEQFAVLRNLLQIRSGDGDLPPMVKNAKAGDEIITIRKDGELQLVKKPFVVTETPDGGKLLDIRANSLDQIETYLPHMAAAVKISEEELRKKLAATSGSIHEKYPAPFEFGLSFGGPEAIRSAAKACLVLWSVTTGTEEIKSGPYNAAIEYINTGDESFHKNRTQLDSRNYERNDFLVSHYGPAYNLIYVTSNSKGRIIGHFTALNLIGFAIVLAEAGGIPDCQVALINDPLTGAWSSDIAHELDVQFTWFENTSYDYETMERSKGRFDALMAYQVAAARSRHLARLIKQVLEGHGLTEDCQVPPDLFSSISQELASRAAHMLMGVGSETPLSQDEMQRRFATVGGVVRPRSE